MDGCPGPGKRQLPSRPAVLLPAARCTYAAHTRPRRPARQVITAASLPPGHTASYLLNSQLSTFNSMLLLHADWLAPLADGTTPTFWVGALPRRSGFVARG